MALYRAFVQHTPAPVLLPNTSTVTGIPLNTTTPTAILMARPDNRRRGFTIENRTGAPMVFALGTTVSATVRTAQLEINDVYEDLTNWQGPVHALSIGAPGNINVTELLIPAS